MNTRLLSVLKYINIFNTLLFIISGYFPYYYYENYVYSYTTGFMSFMMYFTWLGFALILLSANYISKYNISKALISGFIGTIFAGLFIFVFSEAFPHFYGYYIGLILWIVYLINNLFLLLMYFSRKNKQRDVQIRKTILELGTLFTRLKINEVAETCKNDTNYIISIVKKMISKEEIYAEYFTSTNAVVFNQRSNIKEIDDLMAKYREWEDKNVQKV